MDFGYEKVCDNLSKIGTCIGKSFFGRDIFALTFGNGGVLIHGGMHAREHVTGEIVLRLAKYNLEHNVVKNITFVPLVNPDGVELCLRGLASVPSVSRETLLQINKSDDFSLWKANGRGVDLNVNFDADFGKGTGNLRYPAPMGYIGERAESESETQALIRLLNSADYKLTFSFHAKGEEVYYGYNQIDYNPDLTKKVERVLGYVAKTTPNSAGGFKDYCVLKRKIPSYTVEFGSDKKGYEELYQDIDDLMERGIKLLELVRDYD